MIQAVFFDVDGTLVSHTQKGIPQSSLRALQKLREKGILIFLATGRHIMELENLPMEETVFDGYVTLNGQMCLDQHRALFYGSPLPEQDAQTLATMFTSKKVPIMIVEKDQMYINFIDDTVRRAQKAVSSPLPAIRPYSGNTMYQCILFSDDALAKQVLSRLHGSKMSRWNSFGADILCESGGKMIGIQKLLEHYGIQKEHVMAFGDGENDMDMLKYAQIGIAMGNADKDVQEHADYITDDIDEDGIWNALCHYHIL